MQKFVRTFEWCVASALTVSAILLHLRFFERAGALWRDEANSFHLASTPSLIGHWLKYQYDSFPIGWFVALRAWIALAPSGNDSHIRLFGLLVGLTLLAAVWFATRSSGTVTPLFALSLFALNGAVVRYGDSIRGYGLGMMFAVLLVAVYARAARIGTIRSIALASFVGILSVHFLFYNAVVLLALASGTAAVLLSERKFRETFAVLAGGGLAAVSLLIYLPPMRAASHWNRSFQRDIDLGWIWYRIEQTIGTSGPQAMTGWTSAMIGFVVVISVTLLNRHADSERRRRRLFALVAMLTGVPAYTAFLLLLRYPMAPWYVITLLALVAVLIDLALAPHADSPVAWRLVVAGFALAMLIGTWAAAFRTVSERQTNIDLAAKRVEGASEKDLILVTSWPYGISFDHYYRGRAPWMTVPPVADHSVHRYDLATVWATKPESIPVSARVRETLRSGGRVWLISPQLLPAEAGARLPEVELGKREWDHFFLNPILDELSRDGIRCRKPDAPGSEIIYIERVTVDCRCPRPSVPKTE